MQTYRISTWDPRSENPGDDCAWNLRYSGMSLMQLRGVIRSLVGMGYSKISYLIEKEGDSMRTHDALTRHQKKGKSVD